MKSHFLYIVLFCNAVCFAQKQYGLQECIDLALKNSNLTKLADLSYKSSSVDVITAKQNKLPSANAGIGHGLNFGRSIDPSTNGFINEQITRGGFNGQAYLPIWQANQLNNALKMCIRDRYRVVGPLSNHTPFYNAYGLTESNKMWKGAGDRIKVW